MIRVATRCSATGHAPLACSELDELTSGEGAERPPELGTGGQAVVVLLTDGTIRVQGFAMSLVCPRCSRTLEFSGDRPSYCAYCGQRLSDPSLDETSPFTPSTLRDASGNLGETEAHVKDRLAVDSIPGRVDGYTLLRPLGSGGMGTVYEAKDDSTGRKVALKLIAQEFVASRDALERFCQEGRLASMIEHPRCVFVLAADEDDRGRPYIVMELMAGATLQSLVEENGPLSVEDALTKIIDVIDGLREAHQLGVVHRDVKPANCFLDEGGRVKVGDFGLSKSLTQESNLTRTGAFIGTPLYASPEQIKGNSVDIRTDVYSVAATLYYLLAGRPPFQARDAAATLAKIVSEEPPPLRELRKDIPAGLEAVIRRGLDRDRDRRWRDLDELQAALLPFLPSRMSIGGIGLRVGAFLADILSFTAAIFAVHFAIITLISKLRPELIPAIDDLFKNRYFIVHAGSVVIWIVYFALAEHHWGCTFGKWLAGLRVTVARVGGTPAFRRALLRSILFYAVVGLPADVADYMTPVPGDTDLPGPADTIRRVLIMATTTIVAIIASSLMLVSTMRARTGYRGPHEWLSGTRVVRLAHRFRRRVPRSRRRIRPMPISARRPMGVLETIGPYKVRGAVRWEADRKVLLGEDPGLGRQVWIVMRPAAAGSASPQRRDLIRVSRLRWLTGGEQEGSRWDAFIAPAGCPLTDLAGPEGFPWHEARLILEDLAEELAAAVDDGTLPDSLNVDQVWIQPDGRAILVDALASTRPEESTVPSDRRALDLIAQVAALALEGGRWRSGSRPSAIRRAVPRYVDQIFERLLGDERPYTSIREFCADLHATVEKPTHLGRERRALHLLLQTLLLLPGLGMMFGLGRLTLLTEPTQIDSDWVKLAVGVSVAWPIAWIASGIVTHGGLSLRLMRIALVLKDNRVPGRLRCGWRSFLVWAPVAVLLASSIAMHCGWLRAFWGLQPSTLFWIAAGLLPAWSLLALINPQRGPQDWLSGTHLVPE